MFLVSSWSCLRSIHWSQMLSWEWRCSLSSADRRCSNYIWVINNLIAYKGVTYIRGFRVTWQCNDKETLYASLALCEGNLEVMNSHHTRSVMWTFDVSSLLASPCWLTNVKLPVIWAPWCADNFTIMQRQTDSYFWLYLSLGENSPQPTANFTCHSGTQRCHISQSS